MEQNLEHLTLEVTELKKQNAYLIDVINNLTVSLPNMIDVLSNQITQMRAMIAVSTNAYGVDQNTADIIDRGNRVAIECVANSESKFNNPFKNK